MTRALVLLHDSPRLHDNALLSAGNKADFAVALWWQAPALPPQTPAELMAMLPLKAQQPELKSRARAAQSHQLYQSFAASLASQNVALLYAENATLAETCVWYCQHFSLDCVIMEQRTSPNSLRLQASLQHALAQHQIKLHCIEQHTLASMAWHRSQGHLQPKVLGSFSRFRQQPAIQIALLATTDPAQAMVDGFAYPQQTNLADGSWLSPQQLHSQYPQLQQCTQLQQSATQLDTVGVMPAALDVDVASPKPMRFEKLMLLYQDEAELLARVDHYIWQSDLLRHYQQRRNALEGNEHSSVLSIGLARGTLSVRTLWHAIKQWQQRHGICDSSQWLCYELLWREYFHALLQLHGAHTFSASGLALAKAHATPPQSLPQKASQKQTSHLQASRQHASQHKTIRHVQAVAFSSTQLERFTAWCEGNTGHPFVDANMRLLNQTGWMSNRGRQNVASYLCFDLQLDWRLGALWFEQQLLDYDVASNWGNWAYIAGTGVSGPHRFDVSAQQQYYDAQGLFVARWTTDNASAAAPSNIWPKQRRPQAW
jgi:deoxyribodipyrimidine photolyase